MTAPRPFRRRLAAGLPVRQAGFTLIELLIAIVVMLVGIVAVAQLVPAAIRQNFRNRYDSTALIWAQRQLEQIEIQDIKVGNPTVVSTPYFFTNLNLPAATTPSRTVNLGQAPPLFIDAPGNPAPPPVANGATLRPGSVSIDWGQAAGAVPLGYRNQFTSPEGYLYETRWNVMTFYGNINGSILPVGKRVIISCRGGPTGTALTPTTLVTMVGWR